MKYINSNRALTILYNFLINNNLEDRTIILPTNICHDVYFLIEHLGLKIHFIDIDKVTLEPDKKSILESGSSRKKIIVLWNHQYGLSNVPYNFFREIKKLNNNAIIIDDRCLCNPMDYKLSEYDKYIDLIIYSTGRGKQVELNYGAFAFYNDKEFILHNSYFNFRDNIYSKVKNGLFKGDANSFQQTIKDVWGPIEDPEIQKAKYILEIDLEFNKWRKHKSEISETYSNCLNPKFNLPSQFNNWRYNIVVKNKEVLLDKIFENNLFASGHYPSIGTILQMNNFPNSEWLYKNVVNLFIDKNFSKEKARKTVDIINKYGIYH